MVAENRKIIALGMVVVIILTVVVVYLSKQPSDVLSQTIATSSAYTTTVAIQKINASDSVPVQVYATDNAFSPSVFEVTVGEKIALTLYNRGTKPHDLYIPFVDANTTIVAPGANATVIFFAPPTTYNMTFFSTVGNDERSGLIGNVIVVLPR